MHLENAKGPMIVTEDGISIWTNEKHSLNAYDSIEVIGDLIMTLVKNWHPSNALSPNDDIDNESIVISLILLKNAK